MVGMLVVKHTVAGTTLTLSGNTDNVVWSTGSGQYTILEFTWTGSEYIWTSRTKSATAALIQLATPAGFTATANGTTIDLLWEDVADESGFLVEVSDTGTGGWTTLVTNAAGVLSYAHEVGTAGLTKYYRVLAIGNGTTHSNSGYATANATTQAAGPTTLHDSQFTAANGTAIGSYTPETGNVWVNVLGEMEIQSNRMVGKTPNGGGFYVASTEVGTGNVHLTATGANLADSAEGIAFYVRFTDMSNHIVCIFNKTWIEVFSIKNGAFDGGTYLGHTGVGAGTGAHTFEVIATGSTITMKMDGTTYINSVAIPNPQTGTKVCVQLHGAANGSYADNLTIVSA
jgi:hypothetical protein